MLLTPLAVFAAVDRPATIEASGECAIFDVKANVDGTLRVGTKAGKVGERWRVTIAQANRPGAVSRVGSGNAAAYSGFASMAVTANVQYVVLVTWDRPLPGAFPASVTVRFTGAIGVPDPPVVQRNGKPLADIVPRPIRWTEQLENCPGDGAEIDCGDLFACELNPAGDTDAYKVTVPENADLSINIHGPLGSRWKIFDPVGTPINPSGCSGLCEAALAAAGTYTIETYNTSNSAGPYRLSLLGISTPFRCGPVLTAGGPVAQGEFDLAGDTDAFQLNGVSEDEVYSINVSGKLGSRWEIFDPDGNTVNSTGCSGQCQVTLTVAGDYTIVVYNTSNSTGSYTLSAQRVSN